MKTFKCKCGKDILVDDWDFERLSSWNWSCNGLIIQRQWWEGKTRVTVSIGQCVITVPYGMEPDHIDRNIHNNQASNLRPATHSQNMCNQGIRVDNTSGYKGVSWETRRQTWIAVIWKDGKRKHIGSYRTKEEAALAYNKEAKVLHGEFAVLNEVTTLPLSQVQG